MIFGLRRGQVSRSSYLVPVLPIGLVAHWRRVRDTITHTFALEMAHIGKGKMLANTVLFLDRLRAAEHFAWRLQMSAPVGKNNMEADHDCSVGKETVVFRSHRVPWSNRNPRSGAVRRSPDECDRPPACPCSRLPPKLTTPAFT